jgi:acyl carrier protein
MTGAAERARALLAAALEIDLAAVGPDASIGTLEAWDSLAHLRLVQAIERAVGGELSAEAIVGIASLADVAALLERAGGLSAR